MSTNKATGLDNLTARFVKEAIKLAFFRLVEYLENQHLWVRLQNQEWEAPVHN